MWRNHPFSQRNKATKRSSGSKGAFLVGSGQNLKMGWLGNMGGLHKLGGVTNPLPTVH